MKRLWLSGILALLASLGWSQTTTTITGTIKDLTQALVTSGQVTFTLSPSRDTTISGIARFSPQTVTCLITSSGQIVAQNGSSPCILTMNTALNPPGSYYTVAIWPYNVKTSTFTFYAVLSTYDWSTVVPTPTTSPAQNFVDIFSQQTIGGNKTFTGASIFSGASTFAGPNIFGSSSVFSGPSGFTGPITASSIDRCYFVDGVVYTTINAAINAAFEFGCVIIPPGYAGVDTISNPFNIQILDLRGTNNELRIWSGLAPTKPALGFPEGNDLVVRARGPADLWIEHEKTATSTTATLSIGANTNVLVGPVVTSNNRITEDTGTTAQFAASPFVPMFVNREQPDEEQLVYSATAACPTPSTWGIVDATHLCLNTSQNHSGTIDLELIGSTLFTGYDWFLNCAALNPAHLVGRTAPCRIKDQNGHITAYWPTFSADPLPYSGWQFLRPVIVGDNGGFGSSQTNGPSACETSFGITTLSGASTITGQSCLPATAVIDAVLYRITTTITTATSFTIGDSGSATRYCGTQSTLTAGTTGICVAAGYYYNANALPVKITPSTSPGAGAIRLIVYYHTWTPPQS